MNNNSQKDFDFLRQQDERKFNSLQNNKAKTDVLHSPEIVDECESFNLMSFP